jgi:hypothetical protein
VDVFSWRGGSAAEESVDVQTVKRVLDKEKYDEAVTVLIEMDV